MCNWLSLGSAVAHVSLENTTVGASSNCNSTFIGLAVEFSAGIHFLSIIKAGLLAESE